MEGIMDKRILGSIGIVIFLFAVLLYFYLTLPAIYFEEVLPTVGKGRISPFWLAVASWLFGLFVGCVTTSIFWESDFIRWVRQKRSS